MMKQFRYYVDFIFVLCNLFAHLYPQHGANIMNKTLITAAGLMIAGLFSENSFSQAEKPPTYTELLQANSISFTPGKNLKLSSVWVSKTDPKSIKIVVVNSNGGDQIVVQGKDKDGKNGITLSEVYSCEISSATKIGDEVRNNLEIMTRKSPDKLEASYSNTVRSANDRRDSGLIVPHGDREKDNRYLRGQLSQFGLSFN